MATYSTLKKGSRGSSVTDLQKLLNTKGYSLATDGIYGDKTAAAVRDYQTKNKLSVDGITGNQTWTSLYGTQQKSAAPTPAPAPTQTTPRTTQTTPQAAFQSPYSAQIEALLGEVMSQPGFSYDFNADPMYQMYKTQYQQQGQMAMQDTMGNLAALSGGYGNSYAQTAGQQAYQANLQQANNIIPSLMDAAYQRYESGRNAKLNNLSVLQGLEDTAYNRYRSTVADTQADRAFNYAKEQDARSQANWEKEFAYTKSQAAQSQKNWQSEFDHTTGADKKTSATGPRMSYETVLSRLKQMPSVSAAGQYIGQLYEAGSISEEEAEKYYQMARYNLG